MSDGDENGKDELLDVDDDGVAGAVKKDGLVVRPRGEMEGDGLVEVVEGKE